ncbi:hypothetical protein B0H67DRAFT_551317 [Lasiosphaeris hirsuta]|uniref:Uncharacterized protein n=1 Tax=Lasiosphaeris hirsuta TaxID=260670 RepID=A0AA40B1A3_9PEZI|nr:hypothetical protein B0H67DRAFT_551317 [Lasiosphaeris hirsuta]
MSSFKSSSILNGFKGFSPSKYSKTTTSDPPAQQDLKNDTAKDAISNHSKAPPQTDHQDRQEEDHNPSYQRPPKADPHSTPENDEPYPTHANHEPHGAIRPPLRVG